MRMTLKLFCILVLAFGMFFPITARGQSIVLQPVSPNGAFTIEDLWNFSVLFNGPSQFPLYSVQINLSNGNGLICTSTSNDFVPSGSFMIIDKTQLSSLQPISVNYYNSQMQSAVISNGGYFPVGIYQVEIRVYGVNYQSPDGVTAIEIGYSSYSTEVQFLVPPELVYVTNHDTLLWDEVQNTVFSWTAPYPVTNSADLTYTVTFKEKHEGQNEYSAMQNNPVLHFQQGLLTTSYQYPITAPSFEIGKSYAWKVVALLDGVVMETETWDFYVDKEGDRSSTEWIFYTELKRKPDGGYYLSKNGKVCFRYYEEYQVPVSKVLSYIVFDSIRDTIAGVDLSGEEMVPNSPLLPLVFGTNYFILDLNAINPEDYRFYWLEVQNDKKEVWYLKFYLRPN